MDIFAAEWVLVTGASSGIGAAFARRLAGRGARLVLAARSVDRLSALAAELEAAHGTETRVVLADLAAPDGAAALCAAVDALGVPVLHLMNNAGFGLAGPFAAADAGRLAAMVRVNCEALTVLSRHFLPAMLAAGAGGIVHVASVAGYLPMPYQAVYAASKAYVLSLSTALAEEVRGSGVRVLALCPGPVPTGFQAAAGAEGHTNPLEAAVLTADEVTRRGLAAYEAGRAVCVPGAINRAVAAAAGLTPRGGLARLVARVSRRRARA